MRLLAVILSALMQVIPGGRAFLRPLQERDSILIADQLEYGFMLDSLREGTVLALPDFSEASNDTLTLVRGWQLDTLRRFTAKSGGVRTRFYKVEGTVVISPFEEGEYGLPPLFVLRDRDTLMFEAQAMDVKTMPVDTSTYVIKDIKGQMRYPATTEEILCAAAALLLTAALVLLAVWYVRRRRSAAAEKERPRDPAYVVALRELDKYRSDRYWASDRQKSFYSGITDTLKTYIGERYSVDAPEMTTAELFDALKGERSITPELYGEVKELFETADFVKFAKHTVSDEYNAAALPVAVRFVTSTYMTEQEQPSES